MCGAVAFIWSVQTGKQVEVGILTFDFEQKRHLKGSCTRWKQRIWIMALKKLMDRMDREKRGRKR